MAKIRAANHLHRYKKVNLARDRAEKYYVYKCSKPTCSHYIPLHLAEGKMCECNRCGELMVISKIQLSGSGGRAMAKPHCTKCIERKKDVSTISAIADFLKENKA